MTCRNDPANTDIEQHEDPNGDSDFSIREKCLLDPDSHGPTWVEFEFADLIKRVEAEVATWPPSEPEVDPVLAEFRRRAEFGLCDPPLEQL